jgi:hypothetical protein
MKKIKKYLLLILITSTVFLNQSCDILENFFLNLPLKQGITSTGTGTTVDGSETVYLSDYDAYADNIDEIDSIKYLAALYRTLPRGENPSPPPDSLDLTPGLVGEDILVTVTDGDGNLVFTRSLPTAAAEDYLETPYEIELTGDERTLMNQYLADYKDPVKRELLSFTGTVTMNGVPAPPAGQVNVLTGMVEILLELEIKQP